MKNNDNFEFVMGAILVIGWNMNLYNIFFGNPEHTIVQVIGAIAIPVGSIFGLIGY